MIEFYKFSGAGNDFIIFDNRNQFFNKYELGKFSQIVAKRGLGIGADGVIFVENSKRAKIKVRIFNSDGSLAKFCGNGLRCAARFSFLKVIAGTRMSIEIEGLVVEAEVLKDGDVILKFSVPYIKPMMKEVLLKDKILRGYYTISGVPHFVLFVNDIEKIDVSNLGKTIRNAEEFKPEGVNVDFLRDGEIPQYRTYERGVERETLGCGSGAIAIGLILKEVLRRSLPLKLKTRSNRVLEIVELSIKENELIGKLKGDASFIYKGQFSQEFFEEVEKEALIHK